MSRRATIPEGSKCWHTRVLHFGQVSRVSRKVFNGAHLFANEDYHQRRIYTLYKVGI